MPTVVLNQNKKLSLKMQTAASVIAVASAVILPQIFHIIGRLSGMGTSLGEALLPMHLPVIAVGLLAGPYAGAFAGFLSPLVSFALTGMPFAALMPFMMIELCVYGLSSGILRNVKIPVFLKVLIAQIAGRAVRAAAILVSVYGFSNSSISVSIIWKSITAGILGIILQLVILPLAVYRVENASSNE